MGYRSLRVPRQRSNPTVLPVWFESERAAVRGLVAWGDLIELIEPRELIVTVAVRARWIAERYAAAPAARTPGNGGKREQR